jgi:hypothetical protein
MYKMVSIYSTILQRAENNEIMLVTVYIPLIAGTSCVMLGIRYRKLTESRSDLGSEVRHGIRWE